MGNEFVKCCTQTLSYTEEDDDPRDTILANNAKFLHDINELESNTYNQRHHHSPELAPTQNRNNSVSTHIIHQQEEKVMKLDVKQYTNKRIKYQQNKRQEKRTFSVDSKPNFTDIELKETQNEIEILRKQNEMLKKQNEQFLVQYGSFFTSLPKTTPNILTSSSLNSINSINTDISQLSMISYSNEYKQEAMSPLTTLTNDQTHIILSFSNSTSFEALSMVPIEDGDDICIDISLCNTVKRIISALKWYSLCGGDQAVLLKQMVGCKYDKYLLNDYQHISNRHNIVQDNKINLNKEYEFIQNEINKQIKSCDIKICNGYKRYKTLSTKISEDTFVVDILDLIHCVLIHSEYKK